MKKTFLLLLISCLFVACSSDDNDWNPQTEPEPGEIWKNLKLSVEGDVETDGTDYEFEILEGNGEYTADVDEEFAKVTITGNKVKVELLRCRVFIIIQDKIGQNAYVYINSSAESLVSIGYGLIMDTDSEYTIKDIRFGAGGYILEKIKGTSAEAVVTEEDYIKVTALEPGKTYYKIKDKRGTTSKLEIIITDNYDLEGNNLTITTTNAQVINVILKQGEGWELVSTPSSPAIKRITLHTKGHIDGYDTLQIDTSEDDAKGEALIQIKDKSGNYASITVKIQ
jgi:hypothetical protein